MAESKIEWTDRSDWNPIRGCTRVSPGCGGPNHQGGCYAERIAARFSDPGQPFHGFAERTPHGGRWTGRVELVEERLTLPLSWRKPARIFVSSTSDLFHEALSDEAIDRVFAVMALAPQHTFQILTKRADRMRAYMLGGAARRISLIARRTLVRWPLPQVWLGVSVEDQARADERIPELLATPAALRFLSCEPLLGRLDLRDHLLGLTIPYPRTDALHWVIAGGESGPGARPCDLAWARSLRDQCAAAGVPFFWKQWGEWGPILSTGPHGKLPYHHQTGSVRFGKARAGALLDGREHREFPEARP